MHLGFVESVWCCFVASEITAMGLWVWWMCRYWSIGVVLVVEEAQVSEL